MSNKDKDVRKRCSWCNRKMMVLVYTCRNKSYTCWSCWNDELENEWFRGHLEGIKVGYENAKRKSALPVSPEMEKLRKDEYLEMMERLKLPLKLY